MVSSLTTSTSPITEKLSDTIASLQIIPLKSSSYRRGEEFFKVYDVVSALLVQDVARLIEFLIAA